VAQFMIGLISALGFRVPIRLLLSDAEKGSNFNN